MQTHGRRRRRWCVALGAVLVVAGTAGCSSSGSTGGSGGSSGSNAPGGTTSNGGSATSGGPAKKNVTVDLVGAVTPNAYFDDEYCGMQAAAASMGVTVKNATPHDFSAQAQVSAFNSAVLERPDGIIVTPVVASSLVAPIADAVSKGIAVAVVGSPQFDSDAFTFINADIAAATKDMADELAKVLPSGGDVAIVALVANNALDAARVSLFKQAAAAHPNLHIVTTVYTNGPNAVTAAQATSSLLTRYPNLKAIYTTSGTPTTGVATELQALKKSGSVRLVGYDPVSTEVPMIQSGAISGVVSQVPAKAGQLAMQSIVDKVNSKSVPTVQNYPPVLVTQDNVGTPDGKSAVYGSAC